MADNGSLTAAYIKRIIRPIWPKKKYISATDIFYIRLKVNKFIPTLRDKPDYDDFKKRVNGSVLLNGVYYEVDLDDDMAHELVKEMWLDVLQANLNSEDSIVTFVQYLELVQDNAKGFVYKLAIDAKGNVHGVVWQTATMRDNFERFGGYISLDTMKQAINKWLWPYISVVMYNQLNNMFIGCELILC